MLVTVAEYASAVAAHRAADRLDLAGIEAEVVGEASNLLDVNQSSGVRVVVDADDAERARAVLAEPASDPDDPVDEDELTRMALAAGPGERETASEAPAEEEDFVDVLVDQAEASRRYARLTRALALVGIVMPLLTLVTVFRVTFPPEGMHFTGEDRRVLGHARTALYVSLAVVTLAILGNFLLFHR